MIVLQPGPEWRGFRVSLTCDVKPLRGSVVHGYGETKAQAIGDAVRSAIVAAYEKGRAGR